VDLTAKYMDAQLIQPQQTSQVSTNTPFYADWLFWIFICLIFILGIAVYIWIVPFIIKPLVLDIKNDGQTIQVHVKRLIAPSDGFLVMRNDASGIPDDMLVSSPFISAGTYNDFYIPFPYYEDHDYEYYLKLVTEGKFFVTYYDDANYDGFYNDSQVSKNLFGRRLEVVVEKGNPI